MIIPDIFPVPIWQQIIDYSIQIQHGLRFLDDSIYYVLRTLNSSSKQALENSCIDGAIVTGNQIFSNVARIYVDIDISTNQLNLPDIIEEVFTHHCIKIISRSYLTKIPAIEHIHLTGNITYLDVNVLRMDDEFILPNLKYLCTSLGSHDVVITKKNLPKLQVLGIKSTIYSQYSISKQLDISYLVLFTESNTYDCKEIQHINTRIITYFHKNITEYYGILFYNFIHKDWRMKYALD